MRSSTASLSSYEDFYEEWFPKAVRVAHKRGVYDPEAAAQDVMMLFLEKDYLSRHDPTTKGAASIDTWIYNIIEKRMLTQVRTQQRYRDRVETVDRMDDPELTDAHELTEYKVAVMQAFTWIRDTYSQDLADVFVAVVKQTVDETLTAKGHAKHWRVRQRTGFSWSKVSLLMGQLREVIEKDTHLQEILNAHSWSYAAA